MKKIKKIPPSDKYFFDNIPVDPSWNFDNSEENKMHRIHAYPAKFPYFITRKAIANIEQEQGQQIETVGDVFCGCGTTAYEAMLHNKNFWGCDINPVAVLIAKTKSNTYIDSKLIAYFNDIQKYYSLEKKLITNEMIESVNPRIHYWFYHNQIKNLLALKTSINICIPKKSKYNSFFKVAFSNILKSTSKWLQKSIKPTIDPHKSQICVWKAFEKQYRMMQKANKENNIKNSKISIANKSVLKIRSKSKVDLIVSSPPYVTSYEYADLHQMSALWLDYTDDYKILRKGSIGSVYHETDFIKSKEKLMQSGQRIVEQLFKVDKTRAKNTAKYFLDIQTSIEKCFHLLKEKGQAVFVIGNTEYKDVIINNALHLVESMNNVGFKEIYITKRKISNKLLTPYRTKEGKFATKNTANRQIYSEEFIIKGLKQ